VSALRLEEVWFGYDDTPVLKGVSLEIAGGEAVALLGRNGVGKTTLTKLVVALLQPRSGVVRAGGRITEGKAPEDVARLVAYVFQHPDQQLFARTVWSEVAFGPQQQGLSRDETRGIVGDALERVGLEAYAEVHPYDLPAAQRKLVTLAAAIAQRPRVLVLDEPTQGLDRAGVDRVADIIGGLTEDDVAVLAVTHDLAFVAEALERAIVLEDGRVAYDGASRELVLDEHKARSMGLEVPPAAALSVALGLPGGPVRVREVVAALRGERGTGNGRSAGK
jgi:energy-coupling factor transporter ATP-binding protein EcfA2